MSLTHSENLLDDALKTDELLLSSLEAERQRRLTENRLAYYKPYAKQKEFHDAGKTARERLFMAANRVGKSLCGAAEMAMFAASTSQSGVGLPVSRAKPSAMLCKKSSLVLQCVSRIGGPASYRSIVLARSL